MNPATRPLTSALLMLSAASLAAQTPQSGIPTLQVHTRIVQIPTLVQTSSKELVNALTAADFQVTDDCVPQTVTVDPETSRPLSLVVLMQTGDSASHEFLHYLHLDSMLANLLGDAPNQVSIVSFDSKVQGATPFTSDISEWSDAIDHPDSGDHGAAILDALAYALRRLDTQPAANRRAILLLSGPRDIGSKMPLKEIVRAAGETDTSIYAYTFSPEKTELKEALTGPAHLNPPIEMDGPKQAYFNLSAPLGMIIDAMRKNTTAELATLTGGETASFTSDHELADDLNTLNNHLRNRYLLSFTPTSSDPGLHTLHVRLPNHPDLIVSARTNYWSSPQ